MIVTTEDERIIIEFPAGAEKEESFFSELKFRILAERVKEETKWYSFTRQKIQSPTYQRILRMGKQVVPLIWKHLDVQPVLWFHALRTLTGENPVPPEHAGNISLMKQDWTQWAKERKIKPVRE